MNRHWNLSLALGICLCAMLAIGAQAWAHPGGLNTPSPDLPPIIVPGVYLSPSDVHAKYSGPALEIVLKDLKHQPFALLDPNEVRPDGSEHEHFSSTLQGKGTCTGANCGMIPSFFDVFMQGDVRTDVQGLHSIPLPGPYMTEMVAMNLSGMGGVMIRESPTKASTGVTSITDLGAGSGPYHIDSFFDVFTELSLDGGLTWMPSNVDEMGETHSTHVVLGIPEPASVVLVGLALVGLVGLVRRRK